ncbi:type IVB secretion system protein IcmH/DotU [Serratia sp. AKBS12]|uniref:type IVB secretion system protein IcmH/DotU n=1 Tax=Serratia sp. AKBS12 TaxID=2974597 RepID=UPI0021661C03|nr:type IVB secretion system protein IcmH/DotU [Serratia sp. AKBS12]MCS3408372.1 type IVB secretion system protein IcmH/DotU [Serratia sp. AKBS12]
MNEFSEKIREAMSNSRAGLHQVSSLLNSPLGQAGIGSMAAFAVGVRRDGESTAPEPHSAEFHSRALAAGGDAYFTSPATVAEKAIAPGRVGVLSGSWNNVCIAAAMPVLLIVERVRGQRGVDNFALRAQLVRELQNFRQVMLKQQILPEDVRSMSYLLCTFIDGVLAELRDNGITPLNLLIEFHRDSWGGEKSFDDLERYLLDPHQYREILGLYHLILSLGFKGKYHILERGEILLADLFMRLNSLLYERGTTQALNEIKVNAVVCKRHRFSPTRLLSMGVLLCLIAYGGISFYLHDKSRDIRNAIMAWEPPMPRKINIMETLPQPLPQILNEGWLEVREDPRGWLLLFTSDGAFRTGKSVLSPEFVKKRNIERLGEALSGWPGDLEVIGHTDAQPFRSSKVKDPNLRLSQERADMVADKLREGSMVNSKYQRNIVAVGKGDSEPLASNDTEEGRRKNRRVDILWKVGERGETHDGSRRQEDNQTPALLNNHNAGASR